MWALARSLDQCLRPEDSAPTPRPASSAQGERPGDLFNAVVPWDDILTRHGWTFLFHRNGVGYWRRPGKDHGISATTNWGGYDYFYPFTSSTEFDEERGYTRFAVYAILEHGGNFTEAARALKAQGYGAQGPRFSIGTLAGEKVDIATPEAEVDDKDRAIAELRARLIESERERRREAEERSIIAQWLQKEELNPADRIILYKLAADYASRRRRGEDVDGYTLVRLGETDRVARARVTKEEGPEAAERARGYGLAQACGLDAKTVSKAVKKYAEEWEILARQDVRGRTEEGRARSDILVRLPAERAVDVLVHLENFAPEKARNHGGKRESCPRCGSLKTRTVTYCGDCDLILKETTHEPEGLPEDDAGNIPPMPVEELATYPPEQVDANGPIYAREEEAEEGDDWDPYECNHRGCVRPVVIGQRYCGQHRHRGLAPEPAPTTIVSHRLQPLADDLVQEYARANTLAAIDERLARFKERWVVGDHSAEVRALLDDWGAIRVARVAYEAARAQPVGAD